MNDWKRDAERFADLDKAVMAQIEAEDALKYRAKHGRWPELLSERAWEYLTKHHYADCKIKG